MATAEVQAVLNRNITYDKDGNLNTADKFPEIVTLESVEVITPVNANDIATKDYVDTAVAAAVASVNEADEITVDASGFSGNLSGTDTDVQTALDTLDSMVILPTQTNNSGKYLGTNGTTASWSYPTALTRFYTPTIVASPDVAGGVIAASFSFNVPAAAWADFEHIEINNAIFKYFTADGVATETRKIIYDDQDGSPVTSQIASGLAMPNNVTTYYMPCTAYIIRIGTHLYFKDEPMFTNMSLTEASTNGFETSGMIDLGEPDFTKVIGISFNHLLSAASANAIIKCLGVQITHHKLA